MPAVHARSEGEEEPAAKRQSLPTVSPLELLSACDAPPAEEEGQSTPVDQELSRLVGEAEAPSAEPPARFPAEERMRSMGLTAFCDALAFTGLNDELARFSGAGLTILAPTNEAFARLPEEVRHDGRLVRQLLLGHMCAGASALAALKEKECAVAVAGQTHAVYDEDGVTKVGTAGFSRTDFAFEGGFIHELSSVLVVLWLVRDSHSEQVWKKSLQPSPIVSACGGIPLGHEYEVHGCLLHAATGSLVPEALRGHVRAIKPMDGEQRLAFNEITVLTKPPSLAKRRGVDAEVGNNRYRLLFSIWHTTLHSYVSWQHMATPLVVRNSFHMLPIEEKNYRRTQYARSRGRPTPTSSVGLEDVHGPVGDISRARSDSDDGDMTQATSTDAAPPSVPRMVYDKAPSEEVDLSAAGALCFMAQQGA